MTTSHFLPFVRATLHSDLLSLTTERIKLQSNAYCPCACYHVNSRSYQRIWTRFSGWIDCGPEINGLDFDHALTAEGPCENFGPTCVTALHCGRKAHVQSMGKGEFWHPMTSKSLKFFKFELDDYDYVPEFYTSANFHFNPFSGGFSDRWNITVLWLFPSQLVLHMYCIFSRARTRPGRIRGWIFTVYGSYDVFAQGRSFCGLRQYRNSFRGNIPQKLPQKGRE